MLPWAGRVVGDLAAIQALRRLLGPEGSRQAPAAKAQKGMAERDYLSCAFCAEALGELLEAGARAR
jgi:hypothetical protein